MEIPCRVCGRAFMPKQKRSTLCSKACVNRSGPPCSMDECSKPSRARGLCVTHYNKIYLPDSRDRWPRSPEATARSRQNRNYRRRAQLKAEGCEVVDRTLVGDRDGWRCGICHLKVNRDLAYPHPRSPSLDHIVPLSEHGPHTYANTRISHLKCNTDRSNRGAPAQLALIG